MSLYLVFQLSLLLVLVLLSGCFSSSETALTALTKLRIKRLFREKGERAKSLLHWQNDPDSLLTTILIGNNLVNIAASSLATALAIQIGIRHGVTVVIIAMTALILVFGEVVPKTLARRNAEQLALLVSPVLNVLAKILTPLNQFLIGISKLIIRLSPRASFSSDEAITAEHFHALIDLAEEEGIVEEEQAAMFESVFDLANTTAEQIMTPRTDICWLDSEATIEQALKCAIETGYSRIPVAEGSVDHIVGILYVKDLLSQNRMLQGTVQELMRPAIFVLETKNINELLKLFQEKHVHIAIIVDEYGGVSGLVALEDLLEEIVGQLRDEHDKEHRDIEMLENGDLLVNASVRMKKIERIMNVTLPGNRNVKLNSVILEQLGYIPQEGDQLGYGSVVFIISKVENNRIERVRVRKEECLDTGGILNEKNT
ncbi:TPA: HlyC/CorC family transporter [Candidatus Poribacteria bacterium]|nr:HlyC/CorC family transporter [Candidatus Poribacteria bacterium]